jgi:hypothetical protein
MMSGSQSTLEIQSPGLHAYEWITVILIVALMGWLTAITHFKSNALPEVLDQPHYIFNPEIEVWIEGAVKNPGKFKMKRGEKVEDLLERAQPTKEADLSQIRQKTKLKKGQKLNIPALAMITVHIQGAVKQSVSLTIPKGTVLEDLISKIKFEKDANIEKLKKKRVLKEGEVIKVSKKTQKALKKRTINIKD